MKICIIGPVYPYRGGIAHYTASLAKSLRDTGIDTLVISFARQYPGILYPGKTDRDVSQAPIQVPAEYILDPLYPWTWFECVQRIRAFAPDLILFQWWTTFWGPAYWAVSNLLKRHGFKLCFLAHNILPHETRKWDHLIARLALRQADTIIVQAEAEKRKLSELLPKSKSMLIPHPIYSVFANNPVSKNFARAKLGLQPDKIVLLFFGIVRPYKGLKFLLEAISLLSERYNNCTLVVAGEFWEKQSLYDELCQKLKIEERVKIFNAYIPNEDVPLFFSAADIFVAPYIDSTQSGVVKIAMAYNLPIIASDCVIDEILMNDDYVFSVQESNPIALAQTISLVMDRSPFSIIREMPDWNGIVKSIEQIAQ